MESCVVEGAAVHKTLIRVPSFPVTAIRNTFVLIESRYDIHRFLFGTTILKKRTVQHTKPSVHTSQKKLRGKSRMPFSSPYTTADISRTKRLECISGIEYPYFFVIAVRQVSLHTFLPPNNGVGVGDFEST